MKARKLLAAVLSGAIAVSSLAAGMSVSAAEAGDRTKITVLLRASETSAKYIMLKKLLTEFSEEHGLEEPEFELVSGDADYVTKLQLYINSNSLPDIYGCANGALSSAAQDIDGMVNIGEELERIGMKGDMNGAVYDFFKDAEDGNVYLFPESLNCEFFLYRKDIFEEYGLEAPATWDEFLDVCSSDRSSVRTDRGGNCGWGKCAAAVLACEDSVYQACNHCQLCTGIEWISALL